MPKKTQQKLERRRPGQPSKYKPEFIGQVRKLCLLGAIDVEIADFFGISLTTLRTWNLKYPEFQDAQQIGKDVADARVVKSLFMRAVGYTYDSEKIFMPAGGDKAVRVPIREHMPPDVTACIYWTKNRQAELWRDRQDHNHIGTVNHQHKDMTAAEILADLQREAAELGLRLTPSEGDLVLEAIPAPEPAPPTGVANPKANGKANGGGNGTKK